MSRGLPTFTGDGAPSPRLAVKIHAAAADFLLPYWQPSAEFVSTPEEADLILTMNNGAPGATALIRDLRRHGKPVVWWTIEDPNSFDTFFEQALQADVVFTTDAACIPRYREMLGHDRVHWLPLAACAEFHHPVPLAGDAAPFVLSANWYQNEARRWGVATLIKPLCDAGYDLRLYCYANFMWPAEYRRYWRGETSFRTVAEQYRHGRVVLGLNNQRSGMDGRASTVMTSMRTFEALACGKPFLAAHSDAYEALGFANGVHMAWVDRPGDALHWAPRLLDGEGEAMALAGQRFTLAHHTYGHRLQEIVRRALG
jgi:spore maturation protein CgeB